MRKSKKIIAAFAGITGTVVLTRRICESGGGSKAGISDFVADADPYGGSRAVGSMERIE